MVISADRPQHAVPGDLSSALSHNRLLLAIPALCALAYPSLSSLLSAGLVAAHGSPAPNGAIVWVGVVASLALALAVMGVSFVFGLALGSRDGASGEDLRARSIAHLAFATPSLYVGFANVAGVFHAQPALLAAWINFWAAMTGIVRVKPSLSSTTAVMSPAVHRRLAAYHGISASLILLLFVLPHIVNHVVGFWSGAAHIELMKTVRYFYRHDIVQPILLALIGFQVLSGSALLRRRLTFPNDFLGTLQTMCGAYIGVYFLAHMTAVFAARYAGHRYELELVDQQRHQHVGQSFQPPADCALLGGADRHHHTPCMRAENGLATPRGFTRLSRSPGTSFHDRGNRCVQRHPGRAFRRSHRLIRR